MASPPLPANLEEVVVVDAPEADPLDRSPIDDAIAAALRDMSAPESSFTTGETLPIDLPVGGTPVRLELHPLAIGGFVIERYCAGGWRAVSELKEAIAAGLRTMNVFDQPREDARARGIAHASLFSRKLTEAVAQLERLVAEAIVRVAADALATADRRILDLTAHLQTQQARYGIAPVETPVDTSAGGRPGSDNTAPYVDEPLVEVRGARQEALALTEAVRKIVAAHRDLVQTQIAERTEQIPGQEAAGGASGRDTTYKQAPDGRSEDRIRAAQRAFVEACGETTLPPARHTIAPAVFALLKGRRDYLQGEITDQTIWSKAHVYMRDAIVLIATALPPAREYPYAALRERLTIPVEALGVKLPPRGHDGPELRAAIWASERGRGYAYEPLDDEAILSALLKHLGSRLGGGDEDSLEPAFRYRVAMELIAARDVREEIFATRAAAERQPLEMAGRISGVLGLLGLVFPPARIPDLLLSLYTAAGNALLAIREVEAANRAITSQAIGALLDSDSGRFALLVSSRPSVTEIMVKMIGEMATLHLIGQISRGAGVAIQAYQDVQAAVGFENPFGDGEG